jgi:hypothetical protein
LRHGAPSTTDLQRFGIAAHDAMRQTPTHITVLRLNKLF